jgi:hypothetical protein
VSYDKDVYCIGTTKLETRSVHDRVSRDPLAQQRRENNTTETDRQTRKPQHARQYDGAGDERLGERRRCKGDGGSSDAGTRTAKELQDPYVVECQYFMWV